MLSFFTSCINRPRGWEKKPRDESPNGYIHIAGSRCMELEELFSFGRGRLGRGQRSVESYDKEGDAGGTSLKLSALGYHI